MKKFILILITIVTVYLLLIINIKYFGCNGELTNDVLISYYLETDEGTGIYEKQDTVTWPVGYVLNEEKSICKNGSSLEWSNSTNSLFINAVGNDICDIYLSKDSLEDFLPIGSLVNFESFSGIGHSGKYISDFTINDVDYVVYYYSTDIFEDGSIYFVEKNGKNYPIYNNNFFQLSYEYKDSSFYSFHFKMKGKYHDLCVNGYTRKVEDCAIPGWWRKIK